MEWIRIMLKDIEKKVISLVQGDIPVAIRPYRELARRIGLTEEMFLGILDDLNVRGIIRRFGATLRHQKSGFAANAMGAWKVAEERIEEVGNKMAAFRQVSHCYRREPTADWPYNLYTMIHAADAESCIETAKSMSREAGVSEYTLLFSKKEMKKTSMQYFREDE